MDSWLDYCGSIVPEHGREDASSALCAPGTPEPARPPGSQGASVSGRPGRGRPAGSRILREVVRDNPEMQFKAESTSANVSILDLLSGRGAPAQRSSSSTSELLPLATVPEAKVACSPQVTAASLLSGAAAPLLGKTFAHLVLFQSREGTAAAANRPQEPTADTTHLPDGETDDADKGGMMAVIEHSFGDSTANHVKSMSALAEDLGMTRATLGRHKQVLAASLVQAFSVSWSCCLQRVHRLIRDGIMRGHCLIKKRVYDETPLKLRIKVQGGQSHEQAYSVAKTLQSRFSLGMLCERIPSQTFFFMHGLVASPLQVVFRTKAEHLFEAQQAVEGLVPGLDKVAKSFDMTMQMTSTDRYSANEVTEQAMNFVTPDQTRLHLWCDVHRLSACQTWQLGIASSHISGVIGLSLLMREAGALTELRKCISQVFHDRLEVVYGDPPTGQIQAHRKAILKMFLGEDVTKREEPLAGKRARQRATLDFFCNGDWEQADKIQFFSLQPVDKQQLLQAFDRLVVPALLPAGISMFPRHRWHGGELAVDEAGLLFAVHNIGGIALQMFLTGQSPDRALAAESSEDPSNAALDDLDPGELPAVDTCVAESVPQGPQESQQENARSPDATDWKAAKQSMKRMTTAWVDSKPGPVLVVVRAAMTASVRLMRKFLYLASLSWEKHQQLQALRGKKRSFRLLEAWCARDVATAFATLRDTFHTPLLALPLTARTNSIKVLSFRLLARMAGALHNLIRLPRSGFPYRLYGLLSSDSKPELDEMADKLLRSPVCLRDPASKAILSKFANVDALTGPAAKATLEACALLAEVDVVSIETRHASARRLLMARQQSWSPAFADLSAEHLCRMVRTEMHQDFTTRWTRTRELRSEISDSSSIR